jgi:hypothetical protein
MNNKSHVSIEQKVCPVCGKTFDSGSLLMDTRVRRGKLVESMEKTTVTGWDLCEEHQAQTDEGYIHLVEVDPDKSESMDLKGVHRTGAVAAMKREVARDILNIEISDIPMAFIEIGMIDRLQAMQPED